MHVSKYSMWFFFMFTGFMRWSLERLPFCPPSWTIQCTFLFLNATTTTIDGTSAPGMHACGSKESRRAFDFLCDFPSCSLQLARVAPVTSQLCDGRLACYRKRRTTERKLPFFLSSLTSTFSPTLPGRPPKHFMHALALPYHSHGEQKNILVSFLFPDI